MYSAEVSMDASATIWPSRGGLRRAWQNFMTFFFRAGCLVMLKDMENSEKKLYRSVDMW